MPLQLVHGIDCPVNAGYMDINVHQHIGGSVSGHQHIPSTGIHVASSVAISHLAMVVLYVILLELDAPRLKHLNMCRFIEPCALAVLLLSCMCMQNATRSRRNFCLFEHDSCEYTHTHTHTHTMQCTSMQSLFGVCPWVYKP